MVNEVIKLTGSSNHNKCAKADAKDPKAWCYTVDSNTRWEHCSPLCAGSPPSTDPTPLPIHESTGTRFKDVAEQIPQIDPRSKYDRNGNCLKNCKSRSLTAVIDQCGRNDCQEAKPHWARILSWFVPERNHDCSKTGGCFDIIGESSIA